MNSLEKRKLNLLLHLAKIDGKFDSAEKLFLAEFVKAKGLSESLVHEEETPMRCSEISGLEARVELLFLALRLMHADEEIHFKELLFCRNLADKLEFNPAIVDQYKATPPTEFGSFRQEAINNWTSAHQ